MDNELYVECTTYTLQRAKSFATGTYTIWEWIQRYQGLALLLLALDGWAEQTWGPENSREPSVQPTRWPWNVVLL